MACPFVTTGYIVSGARVSTASNFSGPAVRLQDVTCFGDESSLQACSYNTFVDNVCMNVSSIAAVECIFELGMLL